MTKKNLALHNRSSNRARNRPSSSGQESDSASQNPLKTEAVAAELEPHPPLFGSLNFRDWTPHPSTLFKILVSIRLSSAIWAPIGDCDEVYNYWEPLHLLLYGTGFQTWEYSPLYAIRSYAYVLVHWVPIWPFHQLFPHTKMTTFFFLRCFLGFAEALSELYLYRSVCRRLGNGVGRLFALFVTFANGMFVASCAFLPTSFSMTMNALAMAAWLDGRHSLAIFSTALSALLGWPFAAVLGLPIFLEMCLEKWKTSMRRFFSVSLLSGLAIGGVMCRIDSHFFGKIVLAPLNIVLYNVVGGGGGPSLYGTEPSSYYVLNLLLNWNMAFPLSLLSLLVGWLLFRLPYSRREAQICQFFPLVYLNSSLFLWLAIFFAQPHKEERFMFPIYPLIALLAAVTLDCLRQIVELARPKLANGAIGATALAATLFILLSFSRSVALYRNFHAPIDSFVALTEAMAERQRNVDGKFETKLPERTKVCVGKEWYRFPSSFFLPNSLNESVISLEFVKSEFEGLLPKYFEGKSIIQATRAVPTEMNDLNREELSRYIPVDECIYLVDLDEGKGGELEPNYSRDEGNWRIIWSGKFLLASASNRIFRAFYVPIFSDAYCVFGQYNVLERISP